MRDLSPWEAISTAVLLPAVYLEKCLHDWMGLALEQAERAEACGEVPVGAVLIHNGELLAADHNRMITACDPSAHAEMLVLRQGAQRLGNYRLVDTLLLCTLEPCLMCYSAMVHARIRQLIYAAADGKTGIFSTSSFDRVRAVYNHDITTVGGLRAEEASAMLSTFFSGRRTKSDPLT